MGYANDSGRNGPYQVATTSALRPAFVASSLLSISLNLRLVEGFWLVPLGGNDGGRTILVSFWIVESSVQFRVNLRRASFGECGRLSPTPKSQRSAHPWSL